MKNLYQKLWCFPVCPVWSLFKYKLNKCIFNSRRLLFSGKNYQREIRKEIFLLNCSYKECWQFCVSVTIVWILSKGHLIQSLLKSGVAARVSDVTYRPLCLNVFIYSPTLNGTQHNKELSNEYKLMHLIDVLLIWLNGYQHLRFYFALNHLFPHVWFPNLLTIFFVASKWIFLISHINVSYVCICKMGFESPFLYIFCS